MVKFFSAIQPCAIFPSVRCGLEMAMLCAIAARHGCSFLNILHPLSETDGEISKRSSNVKICALLDSNGTPAEVATIATALVEEGFSAIKLKVRKSNRIAVLKNCKSSLLCFLDIASIVCIVIVKAYTYYCLDSYF